MQSLLIIGLGNPGKQFMDTRHNLGQVAIRAWVERLRDGGALVEEMKVQESMHASVQEITYKDRRITILFPDVFMNDSGKAVSQYLRYHEMDAQDILVVHDDLEIPIGAIKFQATGSAHGHNGMRSIHEYLGHADVPQLRIGIGRPIDETPIEKFVLGTFSPEEKLILQNQQQEILDTITTIIEQRPTQE